MGILSNNNNETREMATNFYFPTSKNALIIFTRNPELGKCKTRLAKSIGDESALYIYKSLLQHTAHVSKEIPVDRFVFYSNSIQKNDIWDATVFRKKLQQGDDLGSKMENAFLELFQMGYEKIIIIGSDLLDLKKETINNAFDALKKHKVVIGPAEDGGYYLLGLSNMYHFIFNNKSWSEPKLLEETLTDLEENNILFTTLETLNDIDTYEDLIASKAYQSNLDLQHHIKKLHD
ncbi:TIGR04282 family arsenosugar biosynthesis glycosyltransferase [Mariniflexile litorale]|uniref:TIGR04282 family arsenosugar biosynthesis glycosyltransferase n=1 Tax=Mariniflexile litorale TaxID=3045158 RepID=A0AAU7EB55_9FLAO|nr:TIGR04282 family arsenosugar biosynthesis glycosyltransferase [Mariniflexile sp. KMM 9835]MDQ8210477.1 TIGR04282 family arsenosugar biosynthesis glycosyltransferase [Mariniflexile sp. KMM 9835]